MGRPCPAPVAQFATVPVALAVLWLVWGGLAARAAAAEPAQRVVSMNPSLTQTLVALGAVDRMVGVDVYSARSVAAVQDLPRVGGLFSPSLEAVTALSPDLVVLVPSVAQRDFRSRLEALGVDVLELPNVTLEELLQSIQSLGQRVGRVAAADAVVERIRESLRAARRAAEGSPRPTAVLVLQRDPLFVVGSGSFLDSMLDAVGVENAAARFGDPYPRVDLEWLIAASPQIILDASPDPESPATYWARWPSLPAVAAGRVRRIPPDAVTLPGTDLPRALQILAEAIRPTGELQ